MMKSIEYISIFWFSFGSVLFGASKIYDLAAIEVPFLGKRSTGVSENQLGDKLSIIYGSQGTEIVYLKDNSPAASLSFSKDIFIYCIRWHNKSCWFVIRDGRNVGNQIIGLVELRPSVPTNNFIFYTPEVVNNGLKGFIFDIFDINEKTISVSASFRDKNSTMLSFKKGIINMSDLQTITLDKTVVSAAKHLIKDEFIPTDNNDGKVLKRTPDP